MRGGERGRGGRGSRGNFILGIILIIKYIIIH